MISFIDVIFYLLAAFTLAAAVMVVTVRNPVHAVLFLILTLFNVGGLFILLGAEFLAMILMIVYVGAVAVLFLFVVMMLDIEAPDLRHAIMPHLPVGLIVAVTLFVELTAGILAWRLNPPESSALPTPLYINNVEAIGNVLYIEYAYVFVLAGIILLVAMIGAIALALRQRQGILRQDAQRQISRTREESIELYKELKMYTQVS